jgi:hypothetical protein
MCNVGIIQTLSSTYKLLINHNDTVSSAETFLIVAKLYLCRFPSGRIGKTATPFVSFPVLRLLNRYPAPLNMVVL